ncbi:MAG: YicC family protein [Tissierellia bacterium]|nr:YicC family protein [Tissierellia bacterium]
MIYSMTGFGRGTSTDGVHNFNLEVKTVNHRYLDVIIKMPKHLNYLEEKIKRRIKNRIKRGRVEVYVSLEYINEAAMDVKIDIPLAKAYKAGLDLIIEELNLQDEVKLNHLLTLPEIVKAERMELDEDATWNCLKPALDMALDRVIEMRREEGTSLKEDIESQLMEIEKLIIKIEQRAPLVVEEYRDKLKNRIRELLDEEYDLDEDRLNNEIAFFADKSDINEEIVRINSHIKQFLNAIEEGDVVGRKLDFIIQELNREINTIGSKANDLVIGNLVVEIKSQLEKIREQVQNIE